MTNTNEIKTYMRMKEVPYWKLADRLGVSEATVCRWLRYEISDETLIKYKALVEEIAAEKETGNA